MRKTAREVVEGVCLRHGMTMEQMLGPSHRRRYAWPRHEAMFQVYVQCTWMSLPAIGRLFGGRDHTTVLHGIKGHCKRSGIEFSTVRRKTITRGSMTNYPKALTTPATASDYRGLVRLEAA